MIYLPLLLAILSMVVSTKQHNPSEFYGLSDAELVRARKFIAEEHYVVTTDGYILKLTRILNPLINNGSRGHEDKRPILFIPGESCSGGYYINQANDGEPLDLSKDYDLASSRVDSLIEALKDEPLARSLPLLASCFGFEAWIMHRRGTPYSLGHISPLMQPYTRHEKQLGSTTTGVACCASGVNEDDGSCSDPVDDVKHILENFKQEINPKYWNYSLDEQALTDIPNTLDYMRRLTKQEKVDIVAHSTGSALVMMMLSTLSEQVDKVATLINLGPSLYQANATNPLKLKHDAIKMALTNYTGAFSVANSTQQVQCLIMEACKQQFVRSSCLSDLVPREGQIFNHKSLFPAYLQQTGKPISSRQVLHLIQMREKGRMYAFDYGEEENLARYGNRNPPRYDVSNLRNSGVAMRIFRGRQDSIMTIEDRELLLNDMGFCPIEHYIDNSTIFFSHQSLICHEEVASLVMIPALKDIASTRYPKK